MDFHRARLTRIAARVALLALPLAFLTVFFVWPVATIIGKGVGAEGFREVFTDERLRGIAWFTLWQATVSTLLTLAIALPGAYVLSRYRFFGRSTVRALVTVPFVLPTVVVGAAFSRILPHRFDHTVWAILIAHVFFNYAVVVRVVGGLWANLDPRLAESASVLGAPRWRSMLEIDLPLLAPAIAAAGAIVFLFTFTSFGVVLLLGGPRHSTLEVEIYRQTAELLDLQVAAALALVQLVAVVALLLVTTRMQSRLAVQRRMRRRDETTITVRTRGQRALLGANFAVMLVLLGLPLLALVERSFAVPGGHGLTWYRQLGSTGTSGLFVPPTEAIRNSLVFAMIATVIATVIGGLASIAIGGRHTRAWFDVGLMLPLGVSAVTIGFGFLITLDRPPLDLRAKAILIPIAQALVALPFVVRSVVPVLRSIDDRLREAAAVLGASPSRTWREIDLPLVSRALAVGAGFAFAISLGEFGATVFVARPDTPTLPIAIFRLLGRPGASNYGQAMAMATILMVLTVLCVLVFERARLGDLGEF